MNKIHLLSEKTINRIAAGEVIERPASVVKELVENAIDAGAKNIAVELERGGHNFISVSDDGCGINAEELPTALARHATSKLNEDDINNISFYGFRGEALPSIGSVARMRLISKTPSAPHAFEISIEGGDISAVKPAARANGTTIEVRDIFCFTPVRLKFLKSELAEKLAVVELLERFALANPNIGFKYTYDGSIIFECKPTLELNQRILEVLGEKFITNSHHFDIMGNNIALHGFAGLPTFNHANSARQYTFVNRRTIKDKTVFSALKTAYQNLIPQGRHPALVLFMTIDPYAVDVNVHPSKIEVRFRDEQEVRSLIVSTIRELLRQPLITPTPRASQTMVPANNWQNYSKPLPSPMQISAAHETSSPAYTAPAPQQSAHVALKTDFAALKQSAIMASHPLGEARCQIGELYIISETEEGIVIVDQHAAHERLVLEKMKEQLRTGTIKSQLLLVPEIVDLGQVQAARLLAHAQELKKLGLTIEKNGITQVLIREVPIIFNNTSIKEIIKDLAAYIYDNDCTDILEKKRDDILGNFACHHSIRSGRKLNIHEMNAVLRDIENTDFAGQCNHGRPTYVKLSKAKLADMFERN